MNIVHDVTRRAWLAGVSGGLAAVGSAEAAVEKTTNGDGWGYSLNTSTVRSFDGKNGQSRPIVELVEIAAKAGYNAIEPWIQELNVYVQGGGSLKDLGKRIADAGLVVPDAIGFADAGPESVLDRRHRLVPRAHRSHERVDFRGDRCRGGRPGHGRRGGRCGRRRRRRVRRTLR